MNYGNVSKKNNFFIALLVFFILFSFSVPVHADETPTPTPTPTTQPAADQGKIQELEKQISELQNKITDAKNQQKTLSSQINVMDNQIRLTELRVQATKRDIEKIEEDIETTEKKIGKLEESLEHLTKILLNRIVATYQVGSVQPLQVFLASGTASDFITRANYLRIAQEYDKKLIYETQQARNDYANQKNIFEDKKKKVEALQKQLTAYTAQLDQNKKVKKSLLDITKGDELSYQKLLSQAQAQLAGFQRFAISQGGATILSNQTVCDDWGCYYNQRDSQWGGLSLNNTQYTLASDGCLVTSMAMVYTHLGHRNVTPITINSNSNNFASYYPAFLNKTIVADGVTASRVYASIDEELNAGRPVIIGINYDAFSGADHFLVIISGSNGDYKMNDPFTEGGHNIPFTSKYSVSQIVEIEKVVVR